MSNAVVLLIINLTILTHMALVIFLCPNHKGMLTILNRDAPTIKFWADSNTDVFLFSPFVPGKIFIKEKLTELLKVSKPFITLPSNEHQFSHALWCLFYITVKTLTHFSFKQLHVFMILAKDYIYKITS